jgi:hypothetical protein
LKRLYDIPDFIEDTIILFNLLIELDLYSEVNDANVADYVLNIANDYPVQYETSTFQKVPNGI